VKRAERLKRAPWRVRILAAVVALVGTAGLAFFAAVLVGPFVV
jgi:hypothetical protein